MRQKTSKDVFCGAAVGVSKDTMERVAALVEAGVDVIVVDSAHGHHINIIETVRELRGAYPELTIIAGNVATAETYTRSD